MLLVDTCGSAVSVALAQCVTPEGAVVVAEEVLPGRSASERLVPVVREMLSRQGWRLGQLAAIAVAKGPGSFTGIRVGLSAAKGWSEACRVPVIALSRLEVLAGLSGMEQTVWAVLDAGRGEFYAGRCGENGLQEFLVTGEQLRQQVADERVVVCEAKVAEALSDLRPLMVLEPGARELLQLARKRLEQGEFADVAMLDANYLRRVEQEIAARLVAQGL